MKDNKKIMIYPFDGESLEMVRYSELLKDGDILYAIAPNGWGTIGKDVSCVNNYKEIGMVIDNDFHKILKKIDVVFFNEPRVSIDVDSLIYPKIIKAAKEAKDIICTIQLDNKIVEEIEEICAENNRTFKYFKKDDKINVFSGEENIYTIDTPIVFVSGLSERTNKFDIQLGLRKKLLKKGYKVAQIGTKNYCELIGFHSFPQFMFSSVISESRKVFLFNQYVKMIEIEEKPDIMIIGVPGGIMPYNKEFPNEFGILAFEISQAVLPDFSIVSVLYDDFKPELFNLLFTSCKYKLGYETDCFNVSNASVNHLESKFRRKLSYVNIDAKYINEKKIKYKDLSMPVYNLLDEEELNEMTDFLINRLSGYGEKQYV
ncbi:TIGR04066 family peptide maturation system protein [Clostridium sporogenes]|uniref:TIGR04066 family peptide maturation system protein n=1 Tax=Clostridium sporogenes TaxID=1509 RepID=UPI0022372086|nr:TIGR04066 family peptide maturation system protein [Clostridium sporogenes]MCW6060208.1 TIGR04066 family peptide maturation system protein [Clostridium sporogenes]MCW6068148.1 TIGR04066 family peptide maturation system protein [Clostridium sporogenes]